MQTKEMINHPDHYLKETGFEVIDVIEAWDLDFCLGNAVKYIWRAGLKKNALEDLSKAVWYVNREIKRIEKAEKERPREFIRYQYTESYRITDSGRPYFEERGVCDAQYSVQYLPPTENN